MEDTEDNEQDNIEEQQGNMEENEEVEAAVDETVEAAVEEIVEATDDEPPEEIKVTSEPIQLSLEQIEQSVSLLSKTANGLEHCFTRFEIHGQSFSNTDNLSLYPHLRFIVSIGVSILMDIFEHFNHSGYFGEPSCRS
jgi:histidinol dehydrogenase